MVSQFENLGLHTDFVQVVEQMGFEQPTPIQKAAIPALLQGRNVIGQAQTGTGKTAAFALPMLQQINSGKGGIQALVLAPTRELAIQVSEAISRMAENSKARVLTVYGGQSYSIQLRELKRGVDIVVGTPGRLLDLIRKDLLDLSQVRYLILDEADEMLKMGFIEDVETIMAQIPDERQIALFSATLPKPIRKLADRYMDNPQEISIHPERMTVAETEQHYYRVRNEDKFAALTRLLETEDVKSALIFARTKISTQELSDQLAQRGYLAESLHGDLNQAKRESVLNRFRKNRINLLVATDVAARGLDIEDVSHVFNFDIPEDPEDYVHRIGRTGRAGRKGIAITFVTARERRRLGQIEAYTHQPIKECHMPTREEIIEKRNERFLERLTEQLGKGKISNERAMIARLTETSFDIVEIAAAAIQLARANEAPLQLEEIAAPVEKYKEKRSSRQKDYSSASDSTREKRKKSSSNKNEQKSSKSETSHSKKSQEEGMVRLRMNLGKAQGVRPNDVVGAIAGEVGIPGRAIGEIDIRSDHTFVDVSEKHVRRILKLSTGQYSLRGNPVMLKLA